MKTIQFYAATNRSDNLLHIETDGCIVNIRVGLTDAQGRKVTAVTILPEDESRGGDGEGRIWHLVDGVRVVQQPNDEPDADDLAWARDDMGADATDDEVYEVAARRARERAREPLQLKWETAATDEPGDQNADTNLVDHGYWSLGPAADGAWSVELIEQEAETLIEIPTGGVDLGSFPSEAEAKAAAQAVEDKGHL